MQYSNGAWKNGAYSKHSKHYDRLQNTSTLSTRQINRMMSKIKK